VSSISKDDNPEGGLVGGADSWALCGENIGPAFGSTFLYFFMKRPNLSLA
jgi:hypothetical protein